jgi:hypothetical protein
MKILLTALELESYSGCPLYTRDMALELKRQGHSPEIYTLIKGPIAEELLDANIPVTHNPAQIKNRPDIIHGQHRVSTLIALKQFRDTPALFICHNHTFWGDKAPFHRNILLYLGVSLVCMDSLRKDGVADHKIMFTANFVDIDRFKSQAMLPNKPHKALVFSNYANDETHLPAVREACRQSNLDLDVIGLQANYLHNPEIVLGQYHIIFAKAKAAIESMATGCAVILCDFSGVGPMVTSSEFERLRLMNFGFQALTKSLSAENLLPEISRYDPEDANRVRDLVRTSADLEQVAKHMVSQYEAIRKEYRDSKPNRPANGAKLPLRESFYWERARLWAMLKPSESKILYPVAKIDPAAKEHLYEYVREIQEGPALPFRIWMLIPEPARERITALGLVRMTLDFLKQVLFLSRK